MKFLDIPIAIDGTSRLFNFVLTERKGCDPFFKVSTEGGEMMIDLDLSVLSASGMPQAYILPALTTLRALLEQYEPGVTEGNP